jgi:hypothetical protein
VRTSFQFVSTLAFVFVALPALAQDKAKVAEGEYQMQSKSRSGVPHTKTVTRWVLTAKGTSGYHLESEIQVKPSGTRVLQVEDLDEQFAPTMIGYELYSEGQQKPEITLTCELANRTVVCHGKSGEDPAEISQPFKTSGPYWLWIEGLFLVDMPWLLDGAVNMAHLESGKVNIATITVSDGSGESGDAVNVAKPEKAIQPNQKPTVIAPDKPIPWEVSSDEESPLEFVGRETEDLNGTKVASRHYTFTSGSTPMNLWVAGPGILTRLSQGDGHGDYVLNNFKQYKNLIPELPVEAQPGSAKPVKSD